jgi:predicted flavoprotein YhiN
MAEDAITHGKAGATDVAIALVDQADNKYRIETTANNLKVTKNGSTVGFPGLVPVSAKTAAYTCTAADSGTLFTNTGASGSVTFTLPAVATSTGVWYRFAITADYEVVITAPANVMVAFNDATATSITFTQASEHIGCGATVICDGAKWIVLLHLGAEAQTTVVA